LDAIANKAVRSVEFV